MHLASLQNEPQVIHIVRREPQRTVNGIVPERPNPSQTTPFSNHRVVSHERYRYIPEGGSLTQSEVPFDTQGDNVVRGPWERSQEVRPFENPPVAPLRGSSTNPLEPNFFRGNLAAHGYAPSFQSTFNLSDEWLDTQEEREMNQRPNRIPTEDRLSPIDTEDRLREGRYPEYIFDAFSFTSSLPPSRCNFYPLWRHILEYWFPSTSGFETIQDWDSESSYGRRVIGQHRTQHEPLPKLRPSLAVFHSASSTQPFLFLYIHSGPVNEFICRQARITAEEGFETLRTCSFTAGFDSLCVISAISTRWGMCIREPGWMEDDTGYDYVGEWDEDAISDESFGVMGYYFEEMKKNILRRVQGR